METLKYTPALAVDVLRFQQERIVKNLYIELLMVLEDLGHEHDDALSKLEKALPSEYHQYVGLADYLTPEKGQRLRKRVLDRGNNALRELDSQLKNYDITSK